MSYQLRRINPFWHTHPMIPTAVAIGGILGLMGFSMDKPMLAGVGGIVAGLAVLVASRPVISALLGTLGLFGGMVQFIILPNVSSVGMALWLKLVSALLFGLFYMILMDALVLVVAVLYNLFAGVGGMSGLRVDLESVEEEEAA